MMLNLVKFKMKELFHFLGMHYLLKANLFLLQKKTVSCIVMKQFGIIEEYNLYTLK